MNHPLAGCGVIAVLALSTPAVAQTPGNVLLIVADDVGVDGIGCYGHPNAAPTPVIDGLAAQGVRFTSAHVCPTCSPTRASFLTGRHGFRTGVGQAIGGVGPEGLPASEVILPEILSPANITSALIGKWHLGTSQGVLTPTFMGFDVFTGALQGSMSSFYQWMKIENGQTTPTTTYATTDVVNESLEFIQATSTPWFLIASFNAAHSPYEAPPSHLHTQNLTGLNPQTTPIPFYKAMIEAMDTEIGRLLASMPAATLANTTVLFLGDNGTASQVVEAPFDPQRSKGTIYQGGVRVPMIASGRDVGDPGRVEPSLVHAVDFFHTIAGLQGVDARAAVPANVELDGVDFGALLQSAGQPPVREYLYSQRFSGTTAMSSPGDAELMRDDRYELLRFQQQGSAREELYDLVLDPWETNDLLLQPLSADAEAAYADLRNAVARLRGYAIANPFGSGCSGGGVEPVLRALGEPVIGSLFRMRVTGLTSAVSATFGSIGFDNESWLGTALPLDLTSLGMTGCDLLLAPVSTRLLPQTTAAALWNESVPNDPSLLGLGLYLQAFVSASGANSANALATRGLEVVVGQ
ncbi:MAG: sulfatase-like hydrolase/transferase [Planctomycetota bacterium]|nr:sulfatase-like hydrolase/transferase [Planctomycetota bacterium]